MKPFSKLWYGFVGEVHSGGDFFKPSYTHIFVESEGGSLLLTGFCIVIKSQAYVAACNQSRHQNKNPNVF